MVVKIDRFLGKVGIDGAGVKEEAGGSTTNRVGSSTAACWRETTGAQAESVVKTATARTATMVAPLPKECRAMEAPSSRWKIR